MGQGARLMLKISRRPDETLDDMACRGNAHIKDALQKIEVDGWDIQFYKLVYAWTGTCQQIRPL